MPHELTEHQKIILLKCRLILHNNEPFLHRIVTCNKKMDLIQLVMTSSMAGWKRSYKAPPKAKHALKKGSGHHCLMVCCLFEPLQLSESWWNHYIWELCSANWCDACKREWSAERATIFSTRPDCTSHNQRFRSWTDCSTKFCLICHICAGSCQHQLPLLQASQQLFAGQMLPQWAGGRKCFPRVCSIPKHRFLCYRNKQTYFSLAKMYWL